MKGLDGKPVNLNFIIGARLHLAQFLIFIWIFGQLFSSTDSLHLTGTFSNKQFFKFLAKFGFQQANTNDLTNTKGYIYGRMKPHHTTLDSHETYDMYLVVVDSQYFTEYYSIVTTDKTPQDECPAMFRSIDTIAWDRYCTSSGTEDFLRRTPCKDSLCVEEKGAPNNVMDGEQFTFHIEDPNQPRFWYVSFVACHRGRPVTKKTKQGLCQWSYNASIDLTVDYDIWFVNGDPASKHLNPFEHQFSFELHDVLEIYLVFFVLNGLLLAVQAWFFRAQRHVLIYLITAILTLEVSGIFFNLVHISVFAFDGEGVPVLRIFGNFLDITAQSVMMLQLLLVAKGWTISNTTLSRKPLLIAIWIIYTIIYIILFIFNLISIDVIGDRDEWQTWPGYMILLFRVIIMAYFIYELQRTFSTEHDREKMSFYVRYGAGFLVWFIYLPIVALISPRIAALWRFKTLLSIQSGADFAFTLILVHLFWPSGDSASFFDIPQRNSVPHNGGINDRTTLLTDMDSSSEDELYERQIRLSRLKPNYTHSNSMKPNFSSASLQTCLSSSMSTSDLQIPNGHLDTPRNQHTMEETTF